MHDGRVPRPDPDGYEKGRVEGRLKDDSGAVLVTGGAGFIGSHVTDALLSRGEDVVCLDNFDDFYDPAIKRRNLEGALRSKRFTLIEGDIRDPAALRQVFKSRRIIKVFHAAARAGVRPSLQAPLLYEEINVRGTLQLLEACKDRDIRNFVFASSSSVYGTCERIPFRETESSLQPISPYAATKIAGEYLCRTYASLYGFPLTCARFFTVYGPRQRPEMAIHRFVRLIEQGAPVPVFGDGTIRRDFTYIEDVVAGVLSILDRPHNYEIINLGDSRVVELLEVIRLIESALGKPARIEWRPAQPGDVPVTFADIGKAVSLLGYTPRTAVKDGIAAFVRWYRADAVSRGGAS